MKNNYREYLDVAINAVKGAAKYLDRHHIADNDVLQQTAKDMKFRFDEDAEEIIINELSKNTRFPILTEERGAIESLGEKSHTWIVDPLDGSINYYHNIPLCCVSVSLWQDQNPVLGVIYDFNRGDLYEGIVQEGARLNGSPIKVRNLRKIEESILCTGFPSAMEFTPSAIENFARQVVRFRKVRLLGSAALSLAYVAAGKVDAYYEKNIKIWDVAAGLALVKAAGGDIILDGFPPSHIVEAFGGTSKILIASALDQE